MKTLKYFTIALAIVAGLATGGWTLRNAIIHRISDSLLSDYDVELINISLDALGTSAASIGYLELVHAKGTRIVIEGLTLPVQADENGLRIYAAATVSIITATRDDGAPVEIARLIDQFLSLTDVLPNSEINVDTIQLTPYPAVRSFQWTLVDEKQTLSGIVESVVILASTIRNAPSSYDVVLSLPGKPGSGEPANIADGTLRQSDLGVSITGKAMLDLPGWETLTKMVGIVPKAIYIHSGSAEIQYDVEIPYDAARSPSVTAVLAPKAKLQIAYQSQAGKVTNFQIGESSAVRIEATFPKVEWSLLQEHAALLVTDDTWHEVPLLVRNLSCKSGPACSMRTSISWPDAVTPIGSAELIELSSELDVSFPDSGVRVQVRPAAVLKLLGLATTAIFIDHLEVLTASAAAMQYADDGWSISAASIDANIESLSLTDDLIIAAPFFLENLVMTESEGVVSLETGISVPAVQAAMREQAFVIPGVEGHLALHDKQIGFELATIDLPKVGTIKGRHNTDNESGDIQVDDVALTFDGASLSARVAPWKNDWDVSAGNVDVNFQASWKPNDTHSGINVSASVATDDLSGFYADTVFAGLSSVISVEYGGADGWVVDPTTISIALIEMGLPIENLTADVKLNINTLSAAVDNLQMTVFKGFVSAESFSFHTGRDVNNVTLTAEGIELAELLAIKEFAAIDVTGTMGAVLPITIESDGVSIDGGVLTGEAPGGVIRYLAGGDVDETDTSAIGLATEALSNFEYESLSSNVTYNKDGNLILQMQLKGRNPDMDNSRPVVLNLGVENNVIQMLRSLQAARAVEEILENRLAQ